MGGSPYPGIPMADLLQHLKNGLRMERPEQCPAEIYQMMISCWQKDPAMRPSFHDLETQLEYIVTSKNTVGGFCLFAISERCLKELLDVYNFSRNQTRNQTKATRVQC